MNDTLLERLRGFQLPTPTPVPAGQHLVAHLQGVDFEGILESPDFGFQRPYDVRFGKMMIRTASHLLGGEAGGLFGYCEQTRLSVLLDQREVGNYWNDAVDLQTYLVGLASSKMSLQIEDEALFSCKLYAFAKSELVIAYFMWRRQEAAMTALDRYCTHVLLKSGSEPDSVRKVLEDLGPRDKEEILRQNNLEYSELPAWQRLGTGISLDGSNHVQVEKNLPPESEYGNYLGRFL